MCKNDNDNFDFDNERRVTPGPRPEPMEAGEKGIPALIHECDRFIAFRLGGGMRGRDNVLSVLGGVPSMSQRELQEKLGIQAGSLSELLTRMEHQGLIERYRSEYDGRAMCVTLTGRGLEEAKRCTGRDDDDPFSVLSGEEQAALGELLKKLLDGWNERYGRTARDERRNPFPHGRPMPRGGDEPDGDTPRFNGGRAHMPSGPRGGMVRPAPRGGFRDPGFERRGGRSFDEGFGRRMDNRRDPGFERRQGEDFDPDGRFDGGPEKI